MDWDYWRHSRNGSFLRSGRLSCDRSRWDGFCGGSRRGDRDAAGEAREKLGHNGLTNFLIVDEQSVKNTYSAERKGYDAGKKVSDIKRHVGVDTQGLPYAIAVTTVEVADRSGALQAMSRCKANPGASKACLWMEPTLANPLPTA